jgi:pimeloyl-ACP methyl ester carboxylesterase
MTRIVKTQDHIGISIEHLSAKRKMGIVVVPGFFQSKETPTFRRMASDLFEQFDVIAMDLRGHGKSEGRFTFSSKESLDLKAVLDYAGKIYSRVGVLGFSYGGTIAILEAWEHKNIDSLVCVSAPLASEKIEFHWWNPASWVLGLKGLESGSGVRLGNPFLKKTRAIDVIQTLSPTPVLFIHGSCDPTVSIKHSQELHQKAKNPKELFIFENGSHAEELYRTNRRKFIDTVSGWFGRTL